MPEPQDQFATSIASEAVEVLEDHLIFPEGYLLSLSAHGTGVFGTIDLLYIGQILIVEVILCLITARDEAT